MRDDEEPRVQELIRRACAGDLTARGEALRFHEERLKRLVGLRLNSAVRARVDPSDVVQETLVVADRKLSTYAERRDDLPFFVWLRGLVMNSLQKVHQAHLSTEKRTVRKEQAVAMPLSEESACALAQVAATSGTTPSGRLSREEELERVYAALEGLPEADRELIELFHMEGLSMRETAAILRCEEPTARKRHVRALERLRARLMEG